MRTHIDHYETLSCSEVNGVVRDVVRQAFVEGLVNADFQVLWTLLNEAGVPQYGSGLDGDPTGCLVLVERTAKISNSDTGSGSVVLHYQHFMDSSNQNIGNTTVTGSGTGVIFGRTKSSVQQTKTNFLLNGDGSRTQIVVQHQFPFTDPDVPGRLITQGGEITVQWPQKNFTCTGYIETSTPWLIADNLITTINSVSWMNGPPYTWMCTEVQWEAMVPGVRYKFGFEFQNNPDTWLPCAVFLDERTSRPPPELVEGVGYKYIHYHREVDFNEAFQSYFEGWTIPG